MFRRPTTQNPSNGRARKVATALLLAAMFLVPMTPMGSADFATSTSFNVEAVSGSNTGSSNAHYNFTFTTTGTAGDDTLRLEFPSGWDATAANTSVNHNFPGGSFSQDDSDQASFINLTGTGGDFTAGTEYYVNITGIDPPRPSGTYTITAKLFDGGVLNDTQTDTVAVSALTLGIDLDDAHQDGGSDDMVLASGAVTDYYIEVTWNSGYATTDSVNLTFPTGFDLSAASITNGDIVGQTVGYDIQTTDDDTSTFVFRIEDVENPIVSTNTEFIVAANILDSDKKTIATGSFDIDVIATAIDVASTGSTTIIEEGKTNDDSIGVELRSKPASDVTVTLDGGGQVTFDDDELVFTSANWNTEQTVKLTAIDDSAVEGKVSAFPLLFTSESDDDTYDKLEKTFLIEILDNDAGIVLRHLDDDGTEGDETIVEEGDSTGDRYEVVLSTQPDDSVTITIDAHSNLEVDDAELTFSKSKWDEPQEIKVTSARTDDDDYQDDIDYTILHTAESDDTDYDEEEAELTVTLVDDEHPALGLTEEQIRDANELVELELEETDDGIMLTWTLPEQEDLDEIFDSDGEIEVQGIQILYANSPYTIAETFEENDDEFEDAEWLHDFDDDASLRTKYLVTMYYNEDVGKWDDDDVPDTRDDGYGGLALQDPLLPWWGWLIIGVVGVIIIALILAAVVASQNRRAYGAAEWNDEDEESESPVQATAAAEESSGKQKARKYDLECPVCDHHFTAKGAKPLKTECPNCGAKGVLN